jgi:hypothetical protein
MALQVSVLFLILFVITASITLPYHHYCSAFQIQIQQQPQRSRFYSYSHSRINNNNHFLRNNIKTMMVPQPKSTPTTMMPVDNVTAATAAVTRSAITTSIVDSSPFELFRNYVQSMSPNDNIAITETSDDTTTTLIKQSSVSASASTSFTCGLIPSNDADDIDMEMEMYDTVIMEINTLIFRPIIIKENEKRLQSSTMPIYAVAIVPSSKKVDVKNLSYELSRIKIKKTKQINEEESNNYDNNNSDNDLYTSYDKWELAPSHTVEELCGFAPGTIPPILIMPTTTTTEATTKTINVPFSTIVDSSLLIATPSSTSSSTSSSTTNLYITTNGEINNDRSISNNNNTLLLLGGGGNINYRCLIDSRFLIENVLGIDRTTTTNGIITTTTTTSLLSNKKPNSNKIANIVRSDGSGGIMATTTTEHKNNRPAQQVTPDDNNLYKYYNTKKKPYFPIGPPGNNNNNNLLQKQQQQQQDQDQDQEPHRPVPVTTIGRLLSVRQIAKQLVFADLAPPDYNYQYWLKNRDNNSNNNIDNENKYYKRNATDDGGGMPGPPWRSGEDGEDMYVQIIVGKTFCEKYGNERLKKELKPGRLILIRGAANVDPMQKNGWKNSVGNWATKRSLDVIVSSFEILNENDDDVDEYNLYGNNDNKEQQQQSNWNSLLPWERKHDYERRAVAGGSLENDGIDTSLSSPSSSHNVNTDTTNNILTLDRFNTNLRGTPLKVNIVDTDESIKSMSNHIRELSLKIEENNNNGGSGSGSGSLLKYVAGIDCEWRPTGAYVEAYLDGPDDNPVALLQICIPAIDQVYLVDTHRTIRANLAETESMTFSEEILSETIGAIFGSDEITKVGYGVAIDFRRLAGSFPHIPTFRNVRSVVELSTLAQRLHPSSSSSQHSFGSLQRLTKLVLGYTISKEEQCSNWEARPLTPDQVEYSTLDCALPPRLLDEMAEGSGTAKMKEILALVTSSWRFQTLNGSDRKDAIRLLKAKRVIGSTFVVSQSWLQGKNAPAPTSVPEEGGGPYTDKNGVVQMPAHFVSFGDSGDSTNKEAKWKKMSGKKIGKSKSKCIDLLVDDILPVGASLEYNPRSGFVAFQDGLALFVNLPGLNPSRRMPYPNEWLQDGQILTWYIRKKDWDDGKSDTAKLLGFSADTTTTTTELSSTNIILFTRAGNGEFVCCGKCTASIPDDDDDENANAKLVMLHIHLNDWETMKDSNDFAQILVTQKSADISHKDEEGTEDFSSALQERLSLMVLAGNMIGAFSMALDDANKSPTDRSITAGVSCLRKIFTSNSSDDLLVLRALEILDKNKD